MIYTGHLYSCQLTDDEVERIALVSLAIQDLRRTIQ